MLEIRVNYTFVTPFSGRYEYMEDFLAIENENEFKKTISDVFKKRNNIKDISISVMVPGNVRALVIEKSYIDESIYKLTTFENELSFTKSKLVSFVFWYVDQKKAAA